MPNLLVRDIPDDVHAALQQRAERRGQSLQQYLAGELKRLAEKPTVDEVLDRIERRRGGRTRPRASSAGGWPRAWHTAGRFRRARGHRRRVRVSRGLY